MLGAFYGNHPQTCEVIRRAPGGCKSHTDTQAKMIDAILGLPLRHSPDTPSHGKWTKTAPAMDYYMVANLCGMIAHLLRYSMKKFKLDEARDEIMLTDSAEFDWHKVAGVRFARAKATLCWASGRVRVASNVSRSCFLPRLLRINPQQLC